MMPKILITGSRVSSIAALSYVHVLLHRIEQRGWRILVGDAEGIDCEVIEAAHRAGIPHTIYGAYGKIRHASPSGETLTIPGSYLDRDAWMARECDYCFAIWNGKSTGTIYTYRKALEYGRAENVTAWLRVFPLPKGGRHASS